MKGATNAAVQLDIMVDADHDYSRKLLMLSFLCVEDKTIDVRRYGLPRRPHHGALDGRRGLCLPYWVALCAWYGLPGTPHQHALHYGKIFLVSDWWSSGNATGLGTSLWKAISVL
jgi:hypothetical protein